MPASDDLQSEILQQCLQAVQSRSATIEDCIAQHPEFAELGNLLRSAAAVHELPKVELAPQSRSKLRQRLLAQYDAHTGEQKIESSRRHLRGWQRLAIAACVVLVVLFSGSAALVHAASMAIPGDALYGVKRITEQVQLSLTDVQSRPALLESIANIRLDELVTLASRDEAISAPVLGDVESSVNAALEAQSDMTDRDDLLTRAAAAVQQAENANVIDPVAAAQALHTFSSDSTSPQSVAPTSTQTPLPTSTLTPTPTGLITTPTATDNDSGPARTPKPTRQPPVKPTHPAKPVPPTKSAGDNDNGKGNNGNNNGNGNGKGKGGH